MPKTLTKNSRRLIKATKGRFLSLTAIVCLGVAFFVGISASSIVMGKSVDAYNDEMNLKDITIYSNYGFDEESIQKIKELDDLEEVQASYFQDVTSSSDTETHVTRVHSFNRDDKINHFKVVEGRLPENEHEALAEHGVDMKTYYQIGDVVKLEVPEGTDSILAVDKVTIVGTIDTPNYLALTKENSTISNRYIATYLYVLEDAFDSDYYIEVDATVKGAKELYSFGDEYEELTEKAVDEMEEIAKEEEKNHTERLKETAMEEYNDGLEEYNDAVDEFNEKISDAEDQISDGYEEIETSQATLNNSQKQLDASYQENYQKIQQGLQQIADARAKVGMSEEEAQSNLNKVNEKIKENNIEDLEGTVTTLKSGIAEIEKNEKTIDENIQTIQNGYQTQVDSLTDYQSKWITPYMGQGGTETIGKLNKDLKTDYVEIAKKYGFEVTEDMELYRLNYMVNQKIQAIQSAEASDENIATLNATKEELETKKEELNSQLEPLQTLLTNKTSLETVIQTLQALDKKEQEANVGLTTLEQNRTEAQQKINDGWAELANAEKTLQDSQDELATQKEDGQKELDDAKLDLDDAKREIDNLSAEWTVVDRTSHYASVMFGSAVDQMAAIGDMFPLFFILVAALVCLTTMTRMVNEERSEIGCLRALGYSRFQCSSKYLIYSALATIIGSVLGVIIGMAVFPPIVYSMWNMMYVLPEIHNDIPWNLAFLSSGIFFVMMLGTTWIACLSDMREVPAMLMRPKAPKLGKNTLLERIPFIWNHLTFTWKVTARNIFRYKKRFIMTVVGVAGCAALLVTGFGVRDSISGMVDRQFTQVLKYDGYALLDKGLTEEEAKTVATNIKNVDGIEDAELGRKYTAYTYANGEKSTTVNIEVFENSKEAEDMYLLNTMGSHKDVELSDDGVVISQKLSENLGLSVGDEIDVENADGEKASFQVTGITEMYIYHYVFMTEQCYKDTFGEECTNYSVYITTSEDADIDSVEEKLVAVRNVDSFELYNDTLENFQKTVTSLNAVVWALIISSMLLAFVVLGNLINVNISERQREIATLKVLGFRKREVCNYIYKENNILTMIGAIVGLPAGALLHYTIMHSVEMDYVIYGRVIPWYSYLISFALTIFFGWLVNKLMERKLNSITMVESLKSVE